MIGSLCALGCEVLYGMSYVFTKQATLSASALSLLGWRFVLAFFVMSILVIIGVATVVSIVAGVLLLQENLSIGQIIGAVAIIIGVYTANAKKPAQ